MLRRGMSRRSLPFGVINTVFTCRYTVDCSRVGDTAETRMKVVSPAGVPIQRRGMMGDGRRSARSKANDMRSPLGRRAGRRWPRRIFRVASLLVLTGALACGDRGDKGMLVPAPTSVPTPTVLSMINPAARCFVEAINGRDPPSVMACFAPDGVVIDINRRVQGPDAIYRWARERVIGGRLEVLKERPYAGGTAVLMHWAPRGDAGWLVWYRFEFRDGKLTLVDRQNA